MFFYFSKLVSTATQPLALVALLLLLGLVMARRRPAYTRLINVVALGLLLLMGWIPLPDALIRTLEESHAVVSPQAISDSAVDTYAGAIVVGGAIERAYVRVGNGQSALNGAAERMTIGVWLARQPAIERLVFTGGDGDWDRQAESEAQIAAQFFAEQGVPADKLVLEGASRTTRENAIFTAQLPGIDPTKRWLLVTSGWHMPRTLEAFQRAGWTDLVPYPVDFRAGTSTPWTRYSLADGAQRWQLALHEYLGLWGYRLRG